MRCHGSIGRGNKPKQTKTFTRIIPDRSQLHPAPGRSQKSTAQSTGDYTGKYPCLVAGRFKWILPLLFCVSLSAQLPNGRNHPELRWREFETTHFRILFHQGLDSIAREAAAIAESVYDPITRDLSVSDMDRTTLILADTDDIANGISNPLDHSIFIWITSAHKESTDSLSWLQRVIAHEFAHRVTFQAARNWLGKPWELLTLGLTPLWYLEGVAQWESEHWDVHRNLFLRVAGRSDRLLPVKRLDGFLVADPFDGRLVYEQGHGLSRYIAHEFGPEKVGEIIHRHRRFPFSFNRTLQKTIGRNQKTLYREWKVSLDSLHQSEESLFESPEETNTQIPIPLQVVTGLAFSRDGRLGAVGMERWDEGVQRLIVREKNGRWQQVGGPHAGSSFAFSPDGGTVVIHRKHRGRYGSLFNDLYLIDVSTGAETRLTHSLRASDPVWSPRSQKIAFVKRIAGGSQLWLIDSETGICNCLYDPGNGAEIFDPDWSPDGTRLVFSLVESSGRRRIVVIQKDGSGYRPLTDGLIDTRSPAWSPDGRWIACCDYSAGTPDLIRLSPDDPGQIRMTRVIGGLFNPAWHPDGTQIAVINFERRDSVKAVLIPVNKVEVSGGWGAGRSKQSGQSGIVAVRESDEESGEPIMAGEGGTKQTSATDGILVSEGGVVETQILPRHARPAWAGGEPFRKGSFQSVPGKYSGIRSYRSFASIRPHLILPFGGQDDGGLQLGLIGYASDALNQHQILGYVTQGKRSNVWMNYSCARFGPTLELDVWRLIQDRGQFLIEEDSRLWERRTGGRLSLYWPVNFGRTLLSNHGLSLWVNAQKIENLIPESFVRFNPVFRPFTGWKHSAGASWAWAWSRPDIAYDIHPMTGAGASFGLEKFFTVLGGEVDALQISGGVFFRQELPWKRHVFATRFQNLWRSGDWPIQDLNQLSGSGLLRGLSESHMGDRLLAGSTEYRMTLARDLGIRVSMFYLERLALTAWFDWGRLWGRDVLTYAGGERRGFDQSDWIVTAGPELRLRVFLVGKLNVVLSGGYGFGLKNEPDGAWYLRLGSVF